MSIEWPLNSSLKNAYLRKIFSLIKITEMIKPGIKSTFPSRRKKRRREGRRGEEVEKRWADRGERRKGEMGWSLPEG